MQMRKEIEVNKMMVGDIERERRSVRREEGIEREQC